MGGRPEPGPDVLLPAWVLGTIEHRAVANPQGRVTTGFADRMVERAKAFLGP